MLFVFTGFERNTTSTNFVRLSNKSSQMVTRELKKKQLYLTATVILCGDAQQCLTIS